MGDITMTTVRLREPLKRLAGGRADHALEGATVADVLAALEREQPALAGWILDEQGRVRRHINVYVSGEPGGPETPVGPEDRVDVLPAISGGAR
jgi:molybdopterin converting factor small subunit